MLSQTQQVTPARTADVQREVYIAPRSNSSCAVHNLPAEIAGIWCRNRARTLPIHPVQEFLCENLISVNGAGI
jgi:hypothetical protein